MASKKVRGVFERLPGSGVWWIQYVDGEGHRRREKAGTRDNAKKLVEKRRTEVLTGKKLPEKLRARVVRFNELPKMPRRIAWPTIGGNSLTSTASDG